MSISSAEISVLFGVAELAKRCGLKPGDAEASIGTDEDARGHDQACRLTFVLRYDPETDERMEKFCKLMGLKGEDIENLYAAYTDDMQDRVDKALAGAPRPRHR